MENLKILTKVLKDNVIYIILVIAAIILAFNFAIPQVTTALGAKKELANLEAKHKQSTEEYASLKRLQETQSQKKDISKDGKSIYDAPDMAFSPDASFAPLFELVLTIAQESGIKIRAINYNHSPANDIIYKARVSGYNACTLDMTVVGTYKEIQDFNRAIAKEKHLSSFSELELTPWEKDKKILVTKMKLTLYTRTSG